MANTTIAQIPVFAVIALIAPGFAIADASYVVRDLGTLPGGEFSRAQGLNDLGDVAGESPKIGVGGYTFAVAWINNQIVEVTGSGNRYSGATDINNLREVVGVSDDGTAPFHWANGVVTLLPELEVTGGIANAINDAGTIVGASQLAAGGAVAVRWDNGSVTSLGTLGGPYSEAKDINENDIVVGYAEINTTQRRAFVHDGTNMTDLGTLGGADSEAFALNDAGVIVGRSLYDATWHHAFAYENGNMTDLGTLGGLRSAAWGINTAGDIVGEASESGIGPMVAVIWRNNAITNLNDEIAPTSGWTLHGANAINDRGQIVGVGSYAGSIRGFLMTPLIPGDMNCDAVLSLADIAGFVQALTAPNDYVGNFPDCEILNADVNKDGLVSITDLGPFVSLLLAD